MPNGVSVYSSYFCRLKTALISILNSSADLSLGLVVSCRDCSPGQGDNEAGRVQSCDGGEGQERMCDKDGAGCGHCGPGQAGLLPPSWFWLC